ncbi:peptide synthetase, partial [bacterium M00.F.Ca.ET.155.01.1.1]
AQLGRWNETAVGFEATCVQERIAKQARMTPEAVALVFGDERISYGELEGRANALAAALRARGVGAEVAVGVCVNRSPELLVSLLGIWKAGGVYVPLDPQYPDERLRYMLEDSAAVLVLTDEAQSRRLSDWGVQTYATQQWPLVPTHATVSAGTTADNLAYIIYTSGSTGRPKG